MKYKTQTGQKVQPALPGHPVIQDCIENYLLRGNHATSVSAKTSKILLEKANFTKVPSDAIYLTGNLATNSNLRELSVPALEKTTLTCL